MAKKKMVHKKQLKRIRGGQGVAEIVIISAEGTISLTLKGTVVFIRLNVPLRRVTPD